MTYRFQWCDDCIHHETDLCDSCEAGECFEDIKEIEINTDVNFSHTKDYYYHGSKKRRKQ